MISQQQILDVLDAATEERVFPALDNGYVYLAATRLSLFRSASDWAIVIEEFGYSPRAGLPYVCVCTLASQLRNRGPQERRQLGVEHENYLKHHPNDEVRFLNPMEAGPWQDPNSDDLVADDASEVSVRGQIVSVPSPYACLELGIELCEPPRIRSSSSVVLSRRRTAISYSPRRTSVASMCLKSWCRFFASTSGTILMSSAANCPVPMRHSDNWLKCSRQATGAAIVRLLRRIPIGATGRVAGRCDPTDLPPHRPRRQVQNE